MVPPDSDLFAFLELRNFEFRMSEFPISVFQFSSFELSDVQLSETRIYGSRFTDFQIKNVVVRVVGLSVYLKCSDNRMFGFRISGFFLPNL